MAFLGKGRSSRRLRSMSAYAVAVPIALAAFSIPATLAPRTAHAAPSIQTQFALPGTGADQLPSSITTGPGGNLWFTEWTANIARLTPSGTLTSFPTGLTGCTGVDLNRGIAAGADGNLWFTESCSGGVNNQWTYGEIGRITTAGVVTHFPLPAATTSPPGPWPYGITAGPDGNLWFTEVNANKIGRITTTGTITDFPVPTAASGLARITVGADRNLWFAEGNAAKIGRITTAGAISEFSAAAGSRPYDIAAGADGKLWFTEHDANKIGTMSTSGGGYFEYSVPTASSNLQGITAGPDGALWFSEFDTQKLGRVSTTGVVTEYPVAASPFEITSGPDGNIWYTAYSPSPGVIGRLPFAACGDLTNQVSDAYGSPRATPGGQLTATVTLENCGVPTLTSATTTTAVTPPSGCGAAPVIPAFQATLAYGQSAPPQTTTFSAPSCLGTYTVTSTTRLGSTTVATTTSYYAVSNGNGSQVRGDFNGDGYSDLAIGIPNSVGQVSVVYGSPSGVDVRPMQTFTPLSPGLPAAITGTSYLNNDFGYSTATGDFNHDGYADLAIGIPSYGYPNYPAGQNGGVLILYGSPSGLSARNSQFVAAPSSLTYSAPHGGPGFGFTLASGDFNNDGYADLLIGAPAGSVGSAGGDGAVIVMYGSATGLASGQSIFTQASAGMPGPSASGGGSFGWPTTVGDFNHDGFEDVAIGAAGISATYVLYGSASGLSTQGSQFLAAIGPFGGQAIAAGDFNHDGFADLAVGEPCANVKPSHGIVEVHYGTSAGLGSVGYKTAQEFWPGKKGMPTPPGPAMYFGIELAAGDFNHDGRSDLAVGTDGIGSSGGFYVLRGGSVTLTTKNSQLVMDGSFRQSLGVADLNGDGAADLVVGYFHGGTDIYTGSTGGVISPASIALPLNGWSFSAPGSIGNSNQCGGP